MQEIILSTSYLPPIEYFALLLKSKNVIIEQNETYKKQTYRNRCNIYSEKGVMALSIPVNKPNGNASKTKDIELIYSEKWNKNHWKAICSAYQSSPFFLYYQDDLEEIFIRKYERLLDFNMDLMKKLIELIDIDVNISFTDNFIKPNSSINDFRFSISPKIDSSIKKFPSYIQVFNDRHGFIKNLSIIDLLFNMGPETLAYLRSIEIESNVETEL